MYLRSMYTFFYTQTIASKCENKYQLIMLMRKNDIIFKVEHGLKIHEIPG